MSKYSKRDWHTTPMGDLVLSMQVEVNGETLVVNSMQSRYDSMRGGPPAHYVEREMRAKLMREVELRLLGPAR